MAAGMPRRQWQVEDCPSWCVVDHGEEDFPDDRKHVSEAHGIAVVELVGTERSAVENRSEVTRSTEMVVCLQRRDGAPTTWLYVGDGFDQSIEVSVESWQRLVAQVVATLGRA